jgi:hypothetical protein
METITTKHGYVLPVTKFDSSKPFTKEDAERCKYALEHGLPIKDTAYND